MKDSTQAFPISETSEASSSPLMPTFIQFHSHALTSLLLEKVRDLKARIQDFGMKPKDLLAWLDPVTLSWKTPQYSLIEDLGAFSQPFPRSGMMRSGKCYKVRPLRFSKDVPGFILLPTPTKMDSQANTRKAEFFGVLKPRSRTLGWFIRDGENEGTYPNPVLTAALMTFPVEYLYSDAPAMPSCP